jgi:hypothetical protein
MMFKQILRSVKGSHSTSCRLSVGAIDSLTTYSNPDWVGYPDTWNSTTGFYVFLGDNMVSWSSKRQTTIS